MDINSITIQGPNGDVKLSATGLNNGGNRITNVAPGVAPTDAVNVSQLNEAKDAIADLEESSSKGIAGAMAQAGVKFQEIGINQAVVGAAVSSYRGYHGVAVGLQGAPTENTRVHGIVSATPGKGRRSNPGLTVGASYRFNLK